MKELILSNIEKEFILKAVGERKRLDGREAFACRQVKIKFGNERGCCFVEYENTKVMAQVSCEVAVPKDARPNEGFLTVNVELSPMAAPHFEAGRPSDKAIEVNRLLERCLRESNCLDTESLCIVAGLKVWSIRVDIHVLDFDGNIADAANVAAIAALIHFRRPDVSICGNDVTIHTLEERNPIPLSIHHMPLCTTFAFFDTGKFLVVDPTQREEIVADGTMVVAMNKHREICLLQMSGSMLLLPEQILRCTNIASVKVSSLTELIQSALQNDVEARTRGEVGCAMTATTANRVTAIRKDLTLPIDIASVEDSTMKVVDTGESDAESSCSSSVNGTSASEHNASVTVLDSGIATIGEGGTSSWQEIESEMNEDLEILETKRPAAVVDMAASDAGTVELSDSEEETVMVIGSTEAGQKKLPAAAQTQPSRNTIDLTVALKKKNKNETSKQKRKHP